MCYSLKTEDGSRLWYSAPPKTGSQSIRKFIDDNLPLIKAEAGKSWHVPAHLIVTQVQEFERHSDRIFATIRNPFMVHASNFVYQKQKIEEKIKYIDDPESFKKKSPLVSFKNENPQWINSLLESREKIFDNFDSYIKRLTEWNLPTLYSNNMQRHFLDKHGTHLTILYTLSNFVNSLENKIWLFKIEEPEILSEFFNTTFGVKEDIPHINKTGHSETYKDLFTSKSRAIIEELEAPILKIGNYKY